MHKPIVYRVLNDLESHTTYIDHEDQTYTIEWMEEWDVDINNNEYCKPSITSIDPEPENLKDIPIIHQLFKEKLNEGR